MICDIFHILNALYCNAPRTFALRCIVKSYKQTFEPANNIQQRLSFFYTFFIFHISFIFLKIQNLIFETRQTDRPTDGPITARRTGDGCTDGHMD